MLREVAKEVVLSEEEGLEQLVADMFVTMNESQGVGLATPQVGIGKRLFVMQSYPCGACPDAPLVEKFEVINPVILEQSEEFDAIWESCLSIPGLEGYVERPVQIRCQWQTFSGEVRDEIFEGFPARIFLHESDHLEGVTYLERVDLRKGLQMKDVGRLEP